jgi:hypothetical protein
MHFAHLDFKTSKHARFLAHEFNIILNDIWCTRSFNRGRKRWKDVSKNIPSPYNFRINKEIEHVYLGHGIEQARMAVKSEMEKLLIFAIEHEIK